MAYRVNASGLKSVKIVKNKHLLNAYHYTNLKKKNFMKPKYKVGVLKRIV